MTSLKSLAPKVRIPWNHRDSQGLASTLQCLPEELVGKRYAGEIHPRGEEVFATLIREATLEDAPEIARTHLSTWQTAYRGILPAPDLEGLSEDERQSRWEKILKEAPATGTSVYVAEDDQSRVVGHASCGPARNPAPGYPGELYSIYILEEHQRQGIGHHLVHAVARKLQQSGHPGMLAWVLSASPYRQFYESIGGQLLATRDIEIFGHDYPEVAYGWADVRTLP